MYKKIDTKKLIDFTKTLKVLYVEDNEEARIALENLLSNFFDDIIVSCDGYDGLEKFQNSKFDLVITDINMPKMNGIEMIKNIKKKDDDIPIIISTAYQEQELLMQCIELGVNGYLVKPINHKQLIRSVKCVCGKLYYMHENKKYEKSLELLVKERTHELQLAQERLISMANRDPLTNLYNRRYFNEISETLLKLAKRDKKGLSLLMIDIDKFKKINDIHGHLIGDIVLKKLATTLLSVLRNSDISIRFGGEEFLVLLPETYIKGAQQIAQKVRESVKNLKVPTNENIIKFTISIGVTECFCDKDLTIDDLVHRADEAMYTAKANGRDKVVVYKK